jgi:hypothetical protein
MSNDGKYLAVGIVPGGSEHDTELHVVETGNVHFDDELHLRSIRKVALLGLLGASVPGERFPVAASWTRISGTAPSINFNKGLRALCSCQVLA